MPMSSIQRVLYTYIRWWASNVAGGMVPPLYVIMLANAGRLEFSIQRNNMFGNPTTTVNSGAGLLTRGGSMYSGRKREAGGHVFFFCRILITQQQHQLLRRHYEQQRVRQQRACPR